MESLCRNSFLQAKKSPHLWLSYIKSANFTDSSAGRNLLTLPHLEGQGPGQRKRGGEHRARKTDARYQDQSRTLHRPLQDWSCTPMSLFFFFVPFVIFLLECHCFLMLLVSAVEQSESAMSIRTSPPEPLSFPSRPVPPLSRHRALG